MPIETIINWANSIIEAQKSIESASISGYDNMKHIMDGIQKLTGVVIAMTSVVEEATKSGND